MTMTPILVLLIKLAANLLLAAFLSRLLRHPLGNRPCGAAGPQLLPLWPALAGGLLLSTGQAAEGGGLLTPGRALECCALIFLGWRGGYYASLILDRLAAAPAQVECQVCGSTEGKPRFVHRQGLDFCSHECWFDYLRHAVALKPALFDRQGTFIRQEVYPMSFAEYSPLQAQELLQSGEGYVYVDVRSTPEYEQGHPAGAYNVPILHRQPAGISPNPDFLRVMEAAFPPDTKLLLGCLSGQRSARAAEALVAAGYTCVANVRGGWGGVRDAFGRVVEQGWLELGLPAERGSPAGHGYAELALKRG